MNHLSLVKNYTRREIIPHTTTTNTTSNYYNNQLYSENHNSFSNVELSCISKLPLWSSLRRCHVMPILSSPVQETPPQSQAKQRRCRKPPWWAFQQNLDWKSGEIFCLLQELSYIFDSKNQTKSAGVLHFRSASESTMNPVSAIQWKSPCTWCVFEW